MTADELRILDLSVAARTEWQPPIGALGGPPAHELYHDLVVHAGLRLLRDDGGAPWIEMQDGERRRAFPVPSVELRAALDRFRMRRNLRPVPDGDIQEFVRVVEARILDPDAAIPSPGAALGSPTEPAADAEAPDEPTARSYDGAVERLDRLMREVDEIQGRTPASPQPSTIDPRWTAYVHPVPLHSRLPHRWHAGVSGARRDPSPGGGLPRYLRALRDLVRNGAWIGSLHEIGRRTGDDVDAVFAALLQFHTDLVDQGLVVAPVELPEGWQWVVVDRTKATTDRPGGVR